MAVFRITEQLYPLRLLAYAKGEVELTVSIENATNEPCWTECDVVVPAAISLADSRELLRGRLRIGIINPGEIKQGRCKIYGGVRSYPDIYPIKIIAYGFGKDGAVMAKEEKIADLRCEMLKK